MWCICVFLLVASPICYAYNPLSQQLLDRATDVTNTVVDDSTIKDHSGQNIGSSGNLEYGTLQQDAILTNGYGSSIDSSNQSFRDAFDGNKITKSDNGIGFLGGLGSSTMTHSLALESINERSYRNIEMLGEAKNGSLIEGFALTEGKESDESKDDDSHGRNKSAEILKLVYWSLVLPAVWLIIITLVKNDIDEIIAAGKK